MGETRPVVSVLVACHNYASFLPLALDSVLEQDYPGAIEVIAVDDGSADETPQVLAAYGGRIRSLRQENRGQAAALNAAHSLAKGDVICLLDADDTWHRDKVRKVAEAFAADRSLGLVHHALSTVGADGEPVESDLLSRWQLADGDVRELMRRRVLEWRFMPTSALSVTREVACVVFPLRETLRSSADEFVAPIAALLSPVRYLPEVLGRYRLHGANVWAAGAFAEPAGEEERRRAASRYARLLEEKIAHANDVLGRAGRSERLTPWVDGWYLRCKAAAEGRRPARYLGRGLTAVARCPHLSVAEKAKRVSNLVRKLAWKPFKRALPWKKTRRRHGGTEAG